MNAINAIVNNGSFALDVENGDILFKDGIIFIGTDLSDAQIGYTLSIVIQTMELCLPFFEQLIRAEISVREAFTRIDSMIEAV